MYSFIYWHSFGDLTRRRLPQKSIVNKQIQKLATKHTGCFDIPRTNFKRRQRNTFCIRYCPRNLLMQSKINKLVLCFC